MTCIGGFALSVNSYIWTSLSSVKSVDLRMTRKFLYCTICEKDVEESHECTGELF